MSTDRKATGSDEMLVELLKLIDNEETTVLVNSYNVIYKNEIIPD